MKIIQMIASNLLIFQILTSIIKFTVGTGLCFGALKWKKGLLTATAAGWGLLLGVFIAIVAGDIMNEAGSILCILAGGIIFPILTYTVSGVNRFVLGYLVSYKLSFMLTTVLAKSGKMDLEAVFLFPLFMGVLVGIVLMLWTEIRISAFVLGCTFIGASEMAPAVSEWVNRILFAVTGDYSYVIDPVDWFFSLFGVELTDQWMLISMIVFMVWGGYYQVRHIKMMRIPLSTPLIAYETSVEQNGRIYTGKGYVDTMDSYLKKLKKITDWMRF